MAKANATSKPSNPSSGVEVGVIDGTTPADEASPSRISQMLRDIAAIGADPSGGVSRLAFTDSERGVHQLVAGWLRELGLTVRQDAIGNTIAERPGSEPGAPAIGVGSHVDSVPHGGSFDGTVGVVAAVELARLLVEHDVATTHPIRVVVFVGEEGARFGEPCIGSKAVVGVWQERSLDDVRDAEGVSVADAMQQVGLDPARVPESRWNPRDWAAFLELHVEQGRVLEAEGRQIGLVDTVSGSTRLRIVIRGRAEHSGATPMVLRADALNAAAEVVLAGEALANDPRHHGTRVTIGRLDVHPNSITTIPGAVTLTVDVRDVDSDRQRASTSEIIQHADQICRRRGVQCEISVLSDSSPVILPMWLREVTSTVCRDLQVSYRVLTSGAGHDAQVVNQQVPSAIIFVPSRNGLSHVPEEWTSASDITRGVQVLYHTLLRLDTLLQDLRMATSGKPGSVT